MKVLGLSVLIEHDNELVQVSFKKCNKNTLSLFDCGYKITENNLDPFEEYETTLKAFEYIRSLGFKIDKKSIEDMEEYKKSYSQFFFQE